MMVFVSALPGARSLYFRQIIQTHVLHELIDACMTVWNGYIQQQRKCIDLHLAHQFHEMC